MPSKIFLRRIFLLLTIIVLAAFVVIFFHFVLQDQVEGGLAELVANTTVLLEQKKTDEVGFPIRLKIPKLNIDAAVEHVGLTSNGAVGVPKGSANVAWFNKGPRPGEMGSAIIDGHYGYKNNKLAVFDNLYKLEKGDKIYVEDGKGTTFVFVVQKLKNYDRDVSDAGVFISKDGLSHLNLITCAGDWDNAAKTHSKRLVVFTDKVTP